MQSHYAPESALLHLQELERENRIAKVHHEHLGNGQVRVRQYYTGQRDADLHAAMDADAQLVREAGGQFETRTKIGRNATCPCGSGRKFKKCCMAGARVINRR